MASGCEGFVDGGLDAGELCGGHAGEVQEVGCAVCEGDVEVWGWGGVSCWSAMIILGSFEFILMWWVEEIRYVDLISSNIFHKVRFGWRGESHLCPFVSLSVPQPQRRLWLLRAKGLGNGLLRPLWWFRNYRFVLLMQWQWCK